MSAPATKEAIGDKFAARETRGEEKALSMRLSVVMATRNSEQFLWEALDSVAPALGAQLDVSVEILIADGGSVDGTLNIAERDPRVRIISRQDDGIYSGMNLAIAAASGDFVIILNSDDTLLPGALGEALAVLASTPGAEWISGPVLFGADTSTAELRRHPFPLSIEGAIFGIPAINGRIFRRALLDRIGPLRQDLGLASDREFMVRVADTGATGLAFERPFYLYRIHEGSHTISGDAAGRHRVYKAELQLAQILAATSDTSPRLRRLLRASGAVARLKLKLTGASLKEPLLSNFGAVRDLFRGLFLSRHWRGKLSGY